MLYLFFQNTFGLNNSLLLNSTEKNLFFGKMDIFLEKWCPIWTNEIIQRFVSWYPLSLKKCIKSVSRRHKGSPKPLILLGFRLLWYCQGANPILLKRAKRNFIFPSSLFSPDTWYFIKYILLSRSNPLFMPLSGH